MKLFINDEKIDMQIEKEQYLSDALDSIESSIDSAGGLITSILVNNHSVDFANDNWKNIALDTIDTIHIEATTPTLARTHLIDTFLHYLNIIQHFSTQHTLTEAEELQKKKFLEKPTLSQELSQILSKIDNVSLGFTPLQTSLQTSLQQAFALLGLLETPPILRSNANAHEILTQCIEILQHRKHIMLDENYWKTSTQNILKNSQEIQSITSMITNSNSDMVSINTHIINYIDCIHQWLYTVQFSPQNCSDNAMWKKLHSTYTTKLNTIWEDLSMALENNDWVSVTDIMEYEVIKITEEYANILFQKFGDT